LEDEIAQAFDNLSTVILSTINQSQYPVQREHGKAISAWDYVVKITSYHVNLSQNRPALRDIMVRMLKERFPNHPPLFTMVGIESLPLEENNVEVEAQVVLR
jgi:enamine deaminase RidA (YjgF/YER057c/UK114 family)